MTHTHVTEDQLIEMSLEPADVPEDIRACTECSSRRVHLARTLSEIADAATDVSDAAFPLERLARQRMRIMDRIEHYGQQARVLAFPVSRARHTTSLRPPSVRRWVAGAAAAGLLIGVVAGRLAPDLPSLHVPVRIDGPTVEAVPLRASSDILGDNELLREIEAAVTAKPAALRRLADVTPDAWDVQ
jgi:hypothetical protein